ncbi:unnamed protein product [Mytilus coruscus]|uniref:Uncharacterized protein n=1 Tax=Mytilus coruscus TaxID=42192 RepID=A0A6J8B129_MYTCO|nr:unnamed protein product [Mytilus coruscus]
MRKYCHFPLRRFNHLHQRHVIGILLLCLLVILLYTTKLRHVVRVQTQYHRPFTIDSNIYLGKIKGINISPENYIYDKMNAAEDLEGNFVPNTVYFSWCKRYTIPFNVYLSIFTIWRTLKPDAIVLTTIYDDIESVTNTGEKPDLFIHLENYNDYNMWLGLLKNAIPGFYVLTVNRTSDRDDQCTLGYIFQELQDKGGIYFSNNVFATSSLRSLRKRRFSLAFDKMKKLSFIFTERESTEFIKFKSHYLLEHNNSFIKNSIKCENVNTYTGRKSLCLILPKLNPINVINSTSPFAHLAKRILYERSDIDAQTISESVTPKIVHMVWYGTRYLPFQNYLSLRSVLTILNPEKLYIHGDVILAGYYMQNISKDPRVIFVYRHKPQFVYGNRIKFVALASDVTRCDILLRYGGIYTDWDVIWVKPVDDLILKGYSVVVSFDIVPWTYYPETIQPGVMMAKPKSDFIKHWQENFKNYKPNSWWFNAMYSLYKVYEQFPDSVHFEPRLQVICYSKKLTCHPTFKENFKTQAKKFDWILDDVYSVHATWPDPFPGWESRASVMRGNGMFAEIGRYILHQKYSYDHETVTPPNVNDSTAFNISLFQSSDDKPDDENDDVRDPEQTSSLPLVLSGKSTPAKNSSMVPSIFNWNMLNVEVCLDILNLVQHLQPVEFQNAGS